MKIAVLDDYQDVFRSVSAFKRLEGHEVVVFRDTEKDPAKLADRLRDADAVVLTQQRSAFPRAVIEKLPKLKLIAQTGSHKDHFDVAACNERGIVIAAKGGGRLNSTAELTWALILASLRHISAEADALKRGAWQTTLGTTLDGKTLGIYALGRIGSMVARVGAAFGMRVTCWGRGGSLDRAREAGYEVASSREAFFEGADVLSLHLPLDDSTRGIVKAADLGRMKPTALLANTSRAGLIEEGALVAALTRGRPGRAAVDVYESEPVTGGDHPLLRLPNVLCTPHLGYHVRELYESLYNHVIDSIVAFASGKPINVLNPEALGVRAASPMHEMTCSRISAALALLLGAVIVVAPVPAWAQAYPAKPVRIILPYLGGAEFVGRWLAAKLSPGLGQQVIIDPRPGAGGNIGHEAVAKSAPDGYTLMLASTPFVLNPILNSKTGYDLARDFSPIELVATLPNVLAVHPSVPAKSVRELVQLARAHPGKLAYGSGTVGSTSHLAGELLKSLTKADILLVPYKGATFALVGAMSGEVDVVIPAASAIEPYVKSKRMRVLAVLDVRRLASMPEVPTSAEAGMPQLQIVNWYVLTAPAATPRPIIDRMNAEVVKVMQAAETRTYFAGMGGEPISSTPEEAAAFLREETERWTKVIRAAGIKVE